MGIFNPISGGLVRYSTQTATNANWRADPRTRKIIFCAVGGGGKGGKGGAAADPIFPSGSNYGCGGGGGGAGDVAWGSLEFGANQGLFQILVGAGGTAASGGSGGMTMVTHFYTSFSLMARGGAPGKDGLSFGMAIDSTVGGDGGRVFSSSGVSNPVAGDNYGRGGASSALNKGGTVGQPGAGGAFASGNGGGGGGGGITYTLASGIPSNPGGAGGDGASGYVMIWEFA